MVAQVPRQRQQLERRRQVDVLGRHALEQRRVLRLLFVFHRAALHVGSEAADLQVHRLVRVGADAQRLFRLAGLLQAA